MRALLVAVLVVAAFCTVTAQADCLQVSFVGQIYTLLSPNVPNGLPSYQSKQAGSPVALYLYYNTDLTAGTGAKTKGWACNTNFLNGPVVYDLSFTSTANRPWLSPVWVTGMANPQGAGLPVPAPTCVVWSSSVPALSLPALGKGIPMPMEVQVELPSEICSVLSEEKVSAVLGAVSGVAKIALKCPALVVSCAGMDAAQACPALRERLLSPTSALRRALHSAATEKAPLLHIGTA